METLCFRLQDSVREVQSDVDRLRGEIQSSREEFQVAGREVYQRISTQAKLTGMQMLKIESEMSKFSLGLQELESVRLKEGGSSDGADTAKGKPTVQSIGIQSDIDGGEKVNSRDAKVGHDDRDDRRAHSEWAHSTEPSETTAGASRLMGRGGGKTRGFWKGMDYHYFDEAEQADGLRRRSRPTEDTDGASRPKGRSGDKTRSGEKIRGWWGK